jgi:hypothetical protein
MQNPILHCPNFCSCCCCAVIPLDQISSSHGNGQHKSAITLCHIKWHNDSSSIRFQLRGLKANAKASVHPLPRCHVWFTLFIVLFVLHQKRFSCLLQKFHDLCILQVATKCFYLISFLPPTKESFIIVN